MDAETKKALADARKQGLTREKVASDRMAAFEVGTEVFIERAGMNEKVADDFRGIMQQGIDELQRNPELVKRALDAASAS